ncbi:MAG: glycosyltransferase [Actinobacteria bacterium]|nr:glycosyltransferase [Actinomycetota bacterium]MCG2806941.1 glycosyltransferase [Coriobacteriia bacterium]
MMQPAVSRILQVSASDVGGGAERVAMDLHRAYLARGLDATLAVGARRSTTDGVVEIPGAAPRLPLHWAGRMRRRIERLVADPSSVVDRIRGLEDFNFNGTREVLSLAPHGSDVLHLHNLHGGYFDLRQLPRLSRAVPTAVTLHDTWLTAGHCAYTLDCERWLIGCGECPDITRPMAIPRDSSAANWERKRGILRQSRLFVAGPSRWILDQADQSILAEATMERFLVPNGIDTDVFMPGDRNEARRELGLAPDALIVMYTAGGEFPNPFKDTTSALAALPGVADALADRRVLFVALGAGGTTPTDPRVMHIPFTESPALVARYMQAADAYVHMALAETFGLATVEAQACGLPVVASAVGGIPETLLDGETGVLVPQQDLAALSSALISLGADADRRLTMGTAAARFARTRFTLDAMADGYLAMYDAMLEDAAARS